MASVLFTDIVGFSRNPLERQSELLDRLQQIVRGTKEYQLAERGGHLLKLPTGDGMALVFFQNPVAPVRCAIEIQNALKAHPELALRTGVHTGPIYRQSDIKDNINVVGGGINLAQRVMDCGDAGHILVSRSVAEVLEQLNDWTQYLKALGTFEVKHGVQIEIYNVVRDGAGREDPPSKLKALQKTAPAPSRRLLPVWVGIGVVVLAAAAWFALRPTPAPASLAVLSVPVVEAPQRTLRYHVLLQKFQGTQLVGAPKPLPGESAIESGNGIKLVLSAEEPGNLYVLNEDPESTPAKPKFNIFFPSPKVRNGSSLLQKDDEIQIPQGPKGYLQFDLQSGTEKTWIVWSASEIPQLEALKKWATDEYRGEVKDLVQARALPELLRGFPAERPPKTDKLTELSSSGKVLVHLIQWQHY